MILNLIDEAFFIRLALLALGFGLPSHDIRRGGKSRGADLQDLCAFGRIAGFFVRVGQLQIQSGRGPRGHSLFKRVNAGRRAPLYKAV